MPHRLAAALVCAALAACSAPSGQTCVQTSDCAAGDACNAGVCQHAVDVTITGGPAAPIASTSATFTFSSTVPGATFECRLDTEADYAACTSPKTYTGVPEGSRTFLVRGRVGENVAAPASRSWTVDVTGPVVNLTGYPPAPPQAQSENPRFTFSSPEATATFECSLDSGVWASCTSPVGYTVPTSLAPGPHTFYVRGKDALGNYTAPPVSYPWNQAPETSITCAPLAATNRTTEKVAFGSNVAGATYECQLDSGAFTSCTSPAAFSGLSTAQHTVSVRAIAGGFTDPTPATTTFTVAPTNALLYYNFENTTLNSGVLPGYPASLAGTTPPTYIGGFVFSHGSTGQTGVSLPGSASSWVTIPGVRNVLSHDCVATDAKYTISLWYWEPTTPLQNAFLLDTRPGATGGGFETYHGASGTGWYTCYDTTPSSSACFSGNNPGTNTAHRLAMEYSYDSGTGGYDMKLYYDGALAPYVTGTGQTTGGQTIFNSGMADLDIGKSWSGYIDAVRIYNTTMGGTAP